MTNEELVQSPRRRRLLQSLLAAAALGAVPLAASNEFLDSQAAELVSSETGRLPASPNASVRSPKLVVLELGGGNDALNTFGRFDDPIYQDARRELAIDPVNALHVDGDLMAHPALTGLADRYQRGQVALIESVGDRLTDRSHFSNIARWRSGLDGSGISTSGWLGRYLDQHGSGLSAVTIDWRGLHHPLRGEGGMALALPPNLAALDIDRSTTSQLAAATAFDGLSRAALNPLVAQQMSAVRLAFNESQRFTPLNEVTSPDAGLAGQFALAGSILSFDLGIDIVSLRLNGFDSHAGQIDSSATTGSHADLLAEVSNGIDELFANLTPKVREETVVLVYSEFGRRVAANDSLGTDHGSAGSAMLIGDSVLGGLHGTPPDLTDLDERGDMLPHLQFQQMYASVLEQHLGVDSSSILLGDVEAVPNLIGAPAKEGDPAKEDDKAAVPVYGHLPK